MRTVRIGFAPLVLSLALVGLAAGPAAAEEERPGLDFGIQGGFVYLDEDLAGPDGPTAEPTLGAPADALAPSASSSCWGSR